MSKVVDAFMKDSGYKDYTNPHGIRKDYKRGDNWTFKEPSFMLNEFRLWLNNREGME
jgi:hypothetical protein